MDTLLQLIQDVGVPAAHPCYGAQELQYGYWNQICHDYGIPQTTTEPYSPWQNHMEINIQGAKEAIQHLMQQMHTPKALWNYCASGGCTPHEIITGNTPDVTQFVEFG